ncbi:MAG: hypothetical protein Q8N69_01725 [bacterium]|nr:hypothetical protein [bacterium]
MRKEILFITGGILVLTALAVYFYIGYFFQIKTSIGHDVVVVTDRSEYKPGELLKIKVENKKDSKICFSSCYPYYIQKKSIGWENYVYEECEKENVAENCVGPMETKFFELTLPVLRDGSHRLLLSACLECDKNIEFKAQENLFSNGFIIK